MPSTATSILDGLSTSVAVKPPCRTVALTNITLAGLQTISGYTTEENDRVLVKGQTNPVDNGIYMASTGSWTRAKDADGNRDLVQGTRVLVRSTTIDGAEYELTTANPIVIGTTELTFTLRYGANSVRDQTEREIAVSVTPTSKGFEQGVFERYGAVGDGSTDDTTALRNAFLVGGDVKGTAGKTYRITGPLYLTANDTTIDLRGCTINQVTAATSWLIIGRTVSSSTFVKTNRVRIIGGRTTGAVTGGGSPAYGISVIQPTDNPFVNGNGCNDIQVDGLTSSGFTGGFIASGASNIKIHNCSLGGMLYHIALGAGGYGTLFQTCFDVIVTNNRFKAESTDRHAVYISTYSDPSYPTDNTNVCKGVVIADNLMDWVDTAGVTGFEAAIEVRAAEAITISGNAIYGGYGGIDYDCVNGDGFGVAITNNVIRGIHAGVSQRNAIGVFRSEDDVSFTTTDVVIANNSIQFDDDNCNGIAVDNGNNVVVTGNVINFDEGIDGIIFSDVDNVRVGGNTISSSNGSSAVAFAGTFSDVTVGRGTHKGTFGFEYRYYTNPTGIKFDVPRTVMISWASGTPTIVDEDNIVVSAASDSFGFTVTFRDWVLDLGLSNLSFASSSSNVCSIYRRSVSGQVMTVGILDFAGANLAAASNDYSIAITLKS